MDSELFGELHQEEELGLHGRLHEEQQANEVDTRNESEVCEICEGSGVMKFDETDNAESLCVCK